MTNRWVNLVVLAGSLAAFSACGGGSEGVKLPSKFDTDAVCLACQEEVQVNVRARELPPYTCPSCSEDAVHLWLYCLACKTRCVAQALPPNRDRGMLPPAKCPRCQGGLEAWFNVPDMQPERTAELPAWPPS